MQQNAVNEHFRNGKPNSEISIFFPFISRNLIAIGKKVPVQVPTTGLAPVILKFPGSLNKLLAKLKNRQYWSNALQYRQLSVANVKVIIMNADQIDQKKISCLLVNDLRFSRNNSQYVNDLCEQVYSHRPTYQPMENELCLVSFPKSKKTIWYRARAVKWADDTHLIIQLIDIGCHRVVEQSAIREFNKEFVFDVLVINCIVPKIVDPGKLIEFAEATAHKICLIDASTNTHKIILDWKSFELPPDQI